MGEPNHNIGDIALSGVRARVYHGMFMRELEGSTGAERLRYHYHRLQELAHYCDEKFSRLSEDVARVEYACRMGIWLDNFRLVRTALESAEKGQDYNVDNASHGLSWCYSEIQGMQLALDHLVPEEMP